MAVPQFSSFVASLLSFIPGRQLVDGGDCLALARMVCGANPDIVAFPGGGAANAALVGYGFTRVSVVATGADSVKLPPAVQGAYAAVYNGGANSVQVFGQQANQNGQPAGDQIIPNNSVNAAAVGTGVALASSVVAEFFCFTTGFWKQTISA